MTPIEHSVSSSEPLALLSRTPSIAMSFAVGALLMMCWTTPSPANVLYEYTGNTFDGFFGDPYYEGYFVSVSLTMASLLPPNLVEADIAPYVLDFSFNDGLQTMTKASASGGPFIASTDASGAITQWNLDTVRQQTCEICMPTFFYITTRNIGFVQDAGCQYGGLPEQRCGFADNNSGTWTTIVPEPSTLVLSILGMSIVAAARRLHHQ